MSARAQTLLDSIKTTNWVMQLAIGDSDQDTAVRRLGGDSGPSMVWEVGHMLSYRIRIMKLLGHPRDNPYDPMFSEDATDGSNYPWLSELAGPWQKVADELEQVLGGVTDAELDAPVPDGGPHDERSVYNVVSFLTWHEAYHVGQLGTLRTHFGLTAISELATKQSEEATA